MVSHLTSIKVFELTELRKNLPEKAAWNGKALKIIKRRKRKSKMRASL